MGIAFCVIAFAMVFLAARRSAVAGLTAVFTVGYFYGIVRANFPEAASHFIFDAGVLALYAARLFEAQSLDTSIRTRSLVLWLILLIAWPALLAFLPLQDPLVQLVGLRGAIFLLPFLLFGGRLTRAEIQSLALSLAVLNLIAFVFTAGEYTLGIERFFPHNTNTELIFRSGDVGDNAFRIPSIFTGSHAYAGTMVMTLPLLIGAWASADAAAWKRIVLLAAMAAAIVGVFAAGSRVHTVALAIILLAALFSGRIPAGARVAMLVVMAGAGALVMYQQRLQRFTTLQDSSAVSERLGGSVNAGFFELLFAYPLGNGLGGGGTSLPYFLQDRVRNRVQMENEYARILLEQTSIGLVLWIAFIGWIFSRRFTRASSSWEIGEHLAWLACMTYFGTALIGLGLLTSIPQTAILLLMAGWISSPQPANEYVEEMAEWEYA